MNLFIGVTFYPTNSHEINPKYDLAKLPGVVRGKYAKKYKKGTNIIHLYPDIAKVFKNDELVNQTLRSLIDIAKTQAKVSP